MTQEEYTQWRRRESDLECFWLRMIWSAQMSFFGGLAGLLYNTNFPLGEPLNRTGGLIGLLIIGPICFIISLLSTKYLESRNAH